VTYYHGDHLGSSVVITNGANVQRVLYRPFGQAAPDSDLPVPEFGFTGQRYVDSIGIYDYGARWYEPELGRFLQADSVVPAAYDPQSVNPYSYVRNNPLNRIDPTGNFDWGGVWGGFTGFWGGALGWASASVFGPTWGFASGAGGWVDTNVFDRAGDLFTGFGSGFAGAFAPPSVDTSGALGALVGASYSPTYSSQQVAGSWAERAGSYIGGMVGDEVLEIAGGPLSGNLGGILGSLWGIGEGLLTWEPFMMKSNAWNLFGASTMLRSGSTNGLAHPGGLIRTADPQSKTHFAAYDHDIRMERGELLSSDAHFQYIRDAWGGQGREMGPWGQAYRIYATIGLGTWGGGCGHSASRR
jgi:RHS repeat-associated protein